MHSFDTWHYQKEFPSLFAKHQIVQKQQNKGKHKVLKNNVALFGQLYISMQNRESDLDDFFAHESPSFPPSLSEFGKLYLPGNKSDLLQCIELENQEEPPIFDAAVIVHCLPTVNVNTLGECLRIMGDDIIPLWWDIYFVLNEWNF